MSDQTDLQGVVFENTAGWDETDSPYGIHGRWGDIYAEKGVANSNENKMVADNRRI